MLNVDDSQQRLLRWLRFFALAIVVVTVFTMPALAQDAAEADNSPTQENFLVYCFRASPVFFIIMALMSAWLGTVIFSSFSTLRLPKIIPPATVANLDALLGEKKFKEAYEVLKGDNSLFARSLTTGVERLSHGFDRAMEALIGVAEDGKMEMEHRISPIATIAALAPMMGLLGTVLGMIFAFQQIAAGGQPKPAELAESIGLSLVTTLEGIVVALPALFFFALFKNRVARIAFEVESTCESYLWRFSSALKKAS